MKKNCTILGVIVLITIIILTITACPTGNNGGNSGNGKGGINTTFRFKNAPPPESLGRMARAIQEGTTVDNASFTEMTDFYDELGTVSSTKYTPKKFTLALAGVYAMVNGEKSDFFSGGMWYDFPEIDFSTQGFNFKPTTDAEPGIRADAVTVHLSWAYPSGISGRPNQGEHILVTFTVENMPANHPLRTKNIFEGIYKAWDSTTKEVTVSSAYLLPQGVSSLDFYYYNTTYRFNPTDAQTGGFVQDRLPNNELISPAFVIPMAPVDIPSDANGIVFNISMDLDNIIEQYAGDDDALNTEDDKFVMAKGFWERLAIGATFN
jgi:hypothetical protein